MCAFASMAAGAEPAAVFLPLHINGWLAAVLPALAAVMICVGVAAGRYWLRTAGVVALGVFSAVCFANPPLFKEPVAPLLNYYFFASALAVTGFFAIAHMYYHHPGLLRRERVIVWPAAVIGTALAMVVIRREVLLVINYFGLPFQMNMWVSLAWGLFALFLLILSVARHIKGFLYISLVLLGVAIIKAFLF